MIEVLSRMECTGCGACKSICPHNAIHMEKDEKGFQYPVIDGEYCIDCALCQKTCPILEDRKYYSPVKIFGIKHYDKKVRENSASGGAFTLLAEYILHENGSVYGAAFDSKWKVVHTRVTDIKELNKLRKSKYVQSDLRNSFEKVEHDIKSGKKVLFSGTACSCNGLKNYLTRKNVDISNLYLCDLICHGVPSPKIWEDYIHFNQKRYGVITQVDFRDKEKGWRDFRISFLDSKGRKRSFRQSDDFYFILFFHNYILRDCCHHCKYANISRITDFTLGDFWGIEDNYKEFSDDKGISLLLVNSEKGMKLLESKKNRAESICVSENDCKLRQPNLKKPSSKNLKTDEFWNDYIKKGFNYVVMKYADGTFFGKIKRRYIYRILHKIGVFSFLVQIYYKMEQRYGENK